LTGIEFYDRARPVAEALLQRGVVAKDTQANVLRLAPPLVITAAEIDFLLEQFAGAIASRT